MIERPLPRTPALAALTLSVVLASGSGDVRTPAAGNYPTTRDVSRSHSRSGVVFPAGRERGSTARAGEARSTPGEAGRSGGATSSVQVAAQPVRSGAQAGGGGAQAAGSGTRSGGSGTREEGWVAIDYGALVDRRRLSHSGQSIGDLLRFLEGRPGPPAAGKPEDAAGHTLLDPLLEPFAFVLPDTLDSFSQVSDPPLVEIGYLSHPDEEKALASSAHQDRVALAIFDAINTFRERREKPAQ